MKQFQDHINGLLGSVNCEAFCDYVDMQRAEAAAVDKEGKDKKGRGGCKTSNERKDGENGEGINK